MKEMNELMWCVVERVELVPADAVVKFHMAQGNCCDMLGAITVANGLLQGVKRIETYSGAEPDTAYAWSEDEGEWRAEPRCIPRNSALS